MLRTMLEMERLNDANATLRCADDVVYRFITRHGQRARLPFLLGLREMLRVKYGKELAATTTLDSAEFRSTFEAAFADDRLHGTGYIARTAQLALFFCGMFLESAVQQHLFPDEANERGDRDLADRQEWSRWRDVHLAPLFDKLMAGTVDIGVFAREAAVSYCMYKAADPLSMPGRGEERAQRARARVQTCHNVPGLVKK